jgi:VIT1/CCC1 family predicted Fe2+/Mn2+ transporter
MTHPHPHHHNHPHEHAEEHFTASASVRDTVIGMADGLTVPFALAAGLTGAAAQSAIIVTAGFAEIAAGSIAMGLGGYLAARSDAEHYANELAREEREIIQFPEVEKQEVRDVFESYGLSKEESNIVAESLSKRPSDWVAFMMRFELGLEQPSPSRAWKSGATIASAYVIGGVIPLSAYVLMDDVQQALKVSSVVTLIALAVFGAIKGKLNGVPVMKASLMTVITGGAAATAAFLIARWIS